MQCAWKVPPWSAARKGSHCPAQAERPAPPSTLPVPRDRLTRFFVCRLAPFRLALVPVLLAFRQGQLHLYPAVAEVQPRRNQRQSLLLRLADEFVQLILVHQQLPRAQGFMVEDVAVFVRADVRIDLSLIHISEPTRPY